MDDLRALRLLVFRLGSVLCGAPATAVREVVPVTPATRIPGAPAAVAGLINLRGQLLTVVDGRQALAAGSETAPASVLVLDRGERLAGLAVDEVLDLADVAPEALDGGDPPGGVPAAWVRGVGRYDGRPFVWLDTEALLAPLLG
jgi:purine-binding chemotaxis protein CheW